MDAEPFLASTDPRSAVPPPLTIDDVIAATARDVWRLHAHLVSPAQADDLSQDTFIRVLRALPNFRGESSVRTWVLSIATRTAADEIRRAQRHRRLLGRIMPRDEITADPTGEHDLVDLLQRLDPARRQAFVLTQVLDLDYEAAARLVGCPVGTIRSRVSRARADLIDALSGDRELRGPGRRLQGL